MLALLAGHSGWAVAGVATLALAAALLRGWFWGYPQAPLRDSILSAKEQAVLAAAADALLPAGGVPRMSGSEAGVVAWFAQMLGAVPARQRLLLRLLVRFLEHAPWLALRRRLTAQTPAQRTATFEGWRTSRVYFLRATFTTARMLLAMGYLANPEVSAALGAVCRARPFEEVAK